MKKNMKRTLLAFTVMAMLASSMAVPAMADSTPLRGRVTFSAAFDSEGTAETRENGQNVAQIGGYTYTDFASAWMLRKLHSSRLRLSF